MLTSQQAAVQTTHRIINNLQPVYINQSTNLSLFPQRKNPVEVCQ